jgi:hypothetical protein
MTEKTLQELEAYHNRLVHDVQRVNAIDPGGLNRNTPLVRNLKAVEEQIRQKKNANNT